MEEHTNRNQDEHRDAYGWPTGDAPPDIRTDVRIRATLEDPLLATLLFKAIRDAVGTPNLGHVMVDMDFELQGLTFDQVESLKHLQSISWGFHLQAVPAS